VILPSGAALDYSRPLVMAIVNCTPDSFYAPSRNMSKSAAVDAARRAVEEGADIVDFGGESTRPGSQYIESGEEIRRVLPVIEAFRAREGRKTVPISVDTRKAAVMRLALEAGADIVNDISSLEDDPEMASLAACKGAPVILMHKKGPPSALSASAGYTDVVSEVCGYLNKRADFAKNAGVKHIILDPGIGFGKDTQDNLRLMQNLTSLTSLGYPVLMALSRKKIIGDITGLPPEERLPGTLAANAYALSMGVKILRVHDVAAHRALVQVYRNIYAHA